MRYLDLSHLSCVMSPALTEVLRSALSVVARYKDKMRIKLTAVTGYHGSQGSHIQKVHVKLQIDNATQIPGSRHPWRRCRHWAIQYECNKITLGAGRSHERERDRFERYPEVKYIRPYSMVAV